MTNLCGKMTVPVALFTYARPDILQRTLNALRADKPDLLYVFSDGSRCAKDQTDVNTVRALVRTIDWCDVIVRCSDTNRGLGQSLLKGIGEVLEQHERLIVWEDDIVCAPGTMGYLRGALEHYAEEERVMSVTAWADPRLIPKGSAVPVFTGRFCCLGWGSWRRAWSGMSTRAVGHLRRCQLLMRDVCRYGSDLPELAYRESIDNTWAARFAILHILRRGLCLMPPTSCVAHIGYDARATNAKACHEADPTEADLPARVQIPSSWPSPEEHPEAATLWRRVYGDYPTWHRRWLLNWKYTALAVKWFLRHRLRIPSDRC